MCITRVPGLGVGQVGSSFTGNLHPTPCIEWMQGKRGDPGCMAKARVYILLLARCRMHWSVTRLQLLLSVCIYIVCDIIACVSG